VRAFLLVGSLPRFYYLIGVKILDARLFTFSGHLSTHIHLPEAGLFVLRHDCSCEWDRVY
jgi:hypothetical protein